MDVFAVAVPALLALALTLVGLGSRSLWLDEGATVAIASQHGAALWHAIAHDGGNMLGYYLLEHLVIGLFGPGVAALRLVSVVASCASAGLVGAIALRLFGGQRRHVLALVAGALTAVSLPLVFWGQDARGYALMVALGCGSWLAFAGLMETRHASARARVAYVLCTAGALYVGFDAALLVAAQLVVVLAVRRARWRTIVGCLVVVAAACVPLAVLALQRGSGQLFWVPELGKSVLGQAATTLLSGGLRPNFPASAAGDAAALVSGALVVLAGWLAWRGGDWRSRLPVLWLLVPIVLALAAAAVGEPIELARAAVLLIPAVALLLASMLALVVRPGVPVVAGLVVLAAVLALRAVPLAQSYGVSPEDWKAAAAYVTAHSPAGACVAFYPEDGRMPFDLYVRGAADATRLTPVLPTAPWSRVEPFVERYVSLSRAQLGSVAAGCATVWLVASHEGQRHGTPASAANLRRYDALRAALSARYPHRSERRFGYAAVVRVTRLWR